MMTQLYLKPEEGKFLEMSVVSMLEQLQSSLHDQHLNWDAKTRKMLKDMIAAGSGLKIKLQKMGFKMEDLPPFLDGDEHDFFTKQS
jgi:hypothetical protein